MNKLFWKRNMSTVLTFIGGAGVVATSVLAIKATPKALNIIEEAEEEKGEKLTKLETAKVAGKVYIPTILFGTATIACIFGANMLNKKHQASLMSAYALLDNSYKEYRNKLVELYGEEAHEEIVDAIVIDKAKDVRIYSEYLGSSCDTSLANEQTAKRLFYDEYSNRYFEATIEQVILAEYHLNRNYILRGCAALNELYEFLGLEPTDYGEVAGWAPMDEGMYWIEFNHRKVTIEDDLECYIIEMPFAPFLESEYEDY